MLIAFSVGNVWAAEETYTLGWGAATGDAGTFSNFTAVSGNVQDVVSFSSAKNSSSSNPAYNANAKELRLYYNSGGNGGSVTLTPATNVTITGFVMTTSTAPSVKYSVDGGTATSVSQTSNVYTVTGISASSSLTIQNVNTSNTQLRIKTIQITYETSGDTPTPKTLESVSVSGTPDKTEYFAGQKFDPKGLTVTGYYSDDTNAEITTGITWSYNPAQELAENQTSIKVKATVSDITSEDWFTVSGLTVAAGPDVFIDLVDAGWGFPTEYVVNETSYTNGDITIKLAGSTGNGFKVFTNSNIILGKEGAYLELPAFDSPIERIVVAGNSTGSGKVTWNIFKGNAAVSTAVTGCKEDAYTFNIDPLEANVVYRVKVTNENNLQIKNIQIFFGVAPAVTKPSISGETPFLNSTNVSISIPEGTTVYYTTDGSDPKTEGTLYSAAFDLNNSATVKAIATDGVNWSEVAEKAFTKATIMTVAQARAAIDANPSGIANQYVAGTISKIDSYNSTYKSITYWISDDGTTTNQLQVYSGLAGVVKDHFESKDDLNVGDDVTVKGTLKLHNNSVYEFDYNNTIVIYKTTAQLAWSASSYNASLEGENTFPTLTNTNDVTVTYSSSDPEKAEINETTGAITLKAVGSTTITASFAGNETYKANSVSYTLNVASSLVTLTYNVDGGEAIDPVNVSALPNPLPTTTKAGYNFGGWFTDPEKTVDAVAGAAITENATLYAKWLDPYTVAEAKTVIDANPDGIANQYVTGVISQIDSYNNTYHSITYWISADGATTNQLQVYGGLIGNAATALEKEQFTAKEDLELGDEVVVTGTLKLHNSSVYEFDKNNTIYTFSRKASAGLEYAVTAVNKVVGDADFVNELTNPNSVAVTYATSDDQVAEVANDGTVTIVGEGSATITASFAGTAQYKAAQVSYTLTVSATVDNRKVANSAASGFTATSGNLEPADIAFESFRGGNSNNDPIVYNNTKGIRLYQRSGTNAYGNFVTLTATHGFKIDQVVITTTSSFSTTVAYSIDGNETLSESENVSASSTYSTPTGLNVESINILNTGTGSSGRLEIASIKVYYTGEALTIDHYELGGTYTTEFETGDEFNHDGLIVYAAYDAQGDDKEDITASCTFSEPDMSVAGEKTIEITYKEAVVKSYTINVTEATPDTRKVANGPATFTTIKGDLTPSDIAFEAFKGGSSTNPANYNDGIRLYQIGGSNAFGGYLALTAVKGCAIDQVAITTTSKYATTVAYSIDGNENLLGEEAVAKSGEYTTPAGLNAKNVNILNLGTGSEGRLEIASIKVWYTGDAIAIDHYELGGTYATEFGQYDEFNHEGLIVYAAYDAQGDDKEDITAACTFSEPDMSEAGEKTIEITYKEAVVKSYTITVNASAKEDPAFEYSPASATITAGDEWNAPTLNKAFEVSPISFVSDKPAVATVDENGVITLAGGYGTAVITASFEGDDDYLASEATYTITVNKPAPTPTSTIYRKVTATADITDGEYLIVYEGDATHDAAVFDGSLDNDNIDVAKKVLAVEIENDEIAGNTELDAAVFTIDVTAGSLQSASGLYIGKTDFSNGMDKSATEAYVNTFAITDGAAVITGVGGCTLRYNYAVDQLRFRYYKSGQQAIQLYKKVVVEPEWETVRENLEANRYYTVCLPKKMMEVRGASFWTLSSRNEAGSMAYLEEVDPTTAEAGTPFIIQATDTKLEVVYTGAATTTAGTNGALRGTLNGIDAEAFAALPGNPYLLINNAIRPRTTGNFLAANRAYIEYSALEVNTPQPAPGRRVRAVPMQQNTATGIDELNGSEAPAKVLINGQLFILRGEKMYDAKGQLVK